MLTYTEEQQQWFQDFLLSLLRERGLTRDELAKRCHLSGTTITYMSRALLPTLAHGAFLPVLLELDAPLGLIIQQLGLDRFVRDRAKTEREAYPNYRRLVLGEEEDPKEMALRVLLQQVDPTERPRAEALIRAVLAQFASHR